MSLFNRNPKSKAVEVTAQLDPAGMPEPTSSSEFIRRGYAFYAMNRHAEAENDFQQAAAMDPQSVDAVYGLGMALKAERRFDEGVKAFRQAISLLEGGVIENKASCDMLRRLALGHINEMTSGDWNLEKEIWHHIE